MPLSFVMTHLNSFWLFYGYAMWKTDAKQS